MRRSWNPLWSLPVILAILLLSAAAANARDPWDQTAHDAELARIRAEIEANGYDWIAEETSVSVLSPEERVALLGLVVPDGFKPPIPPENERLINDRTVYDWRNMGGTTGVRSQGNCGSCWAFGLVATLESQIKINDGLELDLSEQQMVSCNTYGYGCDGGWLDAANHMVNPGMVDEWCMPYQASDTVPCTQGSCPNFYQIDDWWYSGDTVTAIKNALQDGPVTTTMTVYDDFYSYSSGCYQHTGSTSVNHCIQIVGWDDSQCSGQGAWIIKNSWGAGWGMSGFAYMKYGTANVGYSTVDTSYTPTNPVTIAYADHEMDDSAGDNDGILDPGETITIMVDLTNLGTATGTFVSATLSCTHLLVTMNDGQADFPDIPAGATRTSLAPHFTATVSSSVAVGTRLTFTLAITAAEGTFSGTFSMPVGELAEVYFSDFESGDAGWTHYQVATQDDWQRGAPQGTSTTDPGAAFSGSGIWGNDLGESGWDGNYKNNINNYLQSPVIDCTGATQTRLSYMRWLAVESGQYDQARIKVNNTVVWENDYSQDHIDTQWTLHEVDISAIADDTPSVQVVFELVSDAGVTFGGWNIDDFAILAIPDVPNPTATPTVPPTATRTPTSAPPTYTATPSPSPTWPFPTMTPTRTPTGTAVPPTHTPTQPPPTATPTFTPTAPPSTATPTFTATPSPTPIDPTATPIDPTATLTPTSPSSTATPTPFITTPQVTLNLNQQVFNGGDPFELNLSIQNGAAILNGELYVVLNAFGLYYWYPAWTLEPESTFVHLQPLESTSMTILSFTLPGPLAPSGPYRFISLLCQQGTYNVISNMDVAMFWFQ